MGHQIDRVDWNEVVTTAARRHHVVARRELIARGVPPAQVRSWLRTGRLHPVHPGVYAGRRPPAGTLVRRRSLASWEVTERDGLAVTTPARTLLDLAGLLGADDLRGAVRRAEHERLLDVAALQAVMSARPNAAGRGTLRRLLEELLAWGPETRSEMEERFAQLVRRHGLPRPVMNTLVGDQLVDAYWPRARLVVELDGYETHGTRSAFGRDRRRTNDLQLAGHLVLRFTYGDVTGDPAGTAARIRAALAARRG